MPYADRKKCRVEDREILHGEFASTSDKCFICNDGRLVEHYDNMFGSLEAGGYVPDIADPGKAIQVL